MAHGRSSEFTPYTGQPETAVLPPGNGDTPAELPVAAEATPPPAPPPVPHWTKTRETTWRLEFRTGQILYALHGPLPDGDGAGRAEYVALKAATLKDLAKTTARKIYSGRAYLQLQAIYERLNDIDQQARLQRDQAAEFDREAAAAIEELQDPRGPREQGDKHRQEQARLAAFAKDLRTALTAKQLAADSERNTFLVTSLLEAKQQAERDKARLMQDVLNRFRDVVAEYQVTEDVLALHEAQLAAHLPKPEQP
jgi:hypothetical protein